MTDRELLYAKLNALRLEVDGSIVDDIKKTVDAVLNPVPPVGLTPQYMHLEKRFNKVCGAITRYYEAGEIIPVNWIDEYNELLIKIKDLKNVPVQKPQD